MDTAVPRFSSARMALPVLAAARRRTLSAVTPTARTDVEEAGWAGAALSVFSRAGASGAGASAETSAVASSWAAVWMAWAGGV